MKPGRLPGGTRWRRSAEPEGARHNGRGTDAPPSPPPAAGREDGDRGEQEASRRGSGRRDDATEENATTPNVDAQREKTRRPLKGGLGGYSPPNKHRKRPGGAQQHGGGERRQFCSAPFVRSRASSAAAREVLAYASVTKCCHSSLVEHFRPQLVVGTRFRAFCRQNRGKLTPAVKYCLTV